MSDNTIYVKSDIWEMEQDTGGINDIIKTKNR